MSTTTVVAAPTADSTTASMQNFTAAWYNHLVNALHLDPASFQLMQGTLPLSVDSTGLYQMADSQPPLSINNYLDTSQWNRFSSEYKQLLYAQKDDSSNNLQLALGDQYPVWITFRNNYYMQNPTSTNTQQQVFTMWANQSLDPGKTPAAMAAFADTLLAPVATAIASFMNQSNYYQGSPVYNKSMDDIRSSLRGTPSANINFNSNSANSNVKQTWAQGNIQGAYSFFRGSASADYQTLNQKASSSAVTITGTITNYSTVPIGPGAWFDAGVFARAYQHDDNYTWDVNKSTNWNSCFGSDGSIERMITGLIIVDGLNLSITSQANYSQQDVQTLKADTSLEFWPFVSAKGNAGSSSDITVNNDGSITVAYTSLAGNPSILGATVKSVAELFGGVK